MGREPKDAPAGGYKGGSPVSEPKTQADKFRDLAREIGAHENAEVFEENLRRIVTAPKPEKPAPEPEK